MKTLPNIFPTSYLNISLVLINKFQLYRQNNSKSCAFFPRINVCFLWAVSVNGHRERERLLPLILTVAETIWQREEPGLSCLCPPENWASKCGHTFLGDMFLYWGNLFFCAARNVNELVYLIVCFLLFFIHFVWKSPNRPICSVCLTIYNLRNYLFAGFCYTLQSSFLTDLVAARALFPVVNASNGHAAVVADWLCRGFKYRFANRGGLCFKSLILLRFYLDVTRNILLHRMSLWK